MAKGLRSSIKYILLLFICLVFLIPIAWALVCSVKPEADIMSYPPKWIPQVFTMSNYTTVLQKYSYFAWGKNSVITAVAGTLMILAFSSLAAYAFAGFNSKPERFYTVQSLPCCWFPFKHT